jgi:imidazolonepropionase-like amidohydrolase
MGSEGIKNALRAGIDSIEHGIFLDVEAIALMLKKKAYLVPTLSAPYHILRAGVKRGIPPFLVEKEKAIVKSNLRSVRKAYRARVSIAMGTDAGTPFNFHGENLKELEILMNVGLTPMEAIVSATKTASELLGLERKIGTLEKGKLADLIIVDGNPLEDIRLLQRKEKILAIIKEGCLFKSNFQPQEAKGI